MRKEVLFICTHNSARSQIAEGLLNHLYPDSYRAYSAGTQARGVNPHAIKVMEEIGIDISHHRSKSIQEFRGKSFDTVVTVCDSARESCPFFPGRRVIHKNYPDPTTTVGSDQEILHAFREARDGIKAWLKEEFKVG
jgi:arsenate reductase